jgi:hypothetical protein
MCQFQLDLLPLPPLGRLTAAEEYEKECANKQGNSEILEYTPEEPDDQHEKNDFDFPHWRYPRPAQTTLENREHRLSFLPAMCLLSIPTIARNRSLG